MSAGAQQALKQLTGSDIEPGGLLDIEQSGFLNEVQEQAMLLDTVRVRPVNRDKTEITQIGVGERMRQSQSEATSGGGSGSVTTDPIQIDTEKGSVYWGLSKEMMEDNLEREQLANRILNLMARQFGVDTQDLAINGDEAGSGFVTQNDGWLKIASDRGMPTYDHTDGSSNPQDIDETVFNEAIMTIPQKYLRSGDPMFFMSRQQLQAFKFGQVTRETPLGDAFLQGEAEANPFGYDIMGVAAWPQDKAMFTAPQNLIYAPYREMEVDVLRDSDEIHAKDLFAKYAMRVRDDFQIEEENAGVLITGLTDPTA